MNKKINIFLLMTVLSLQGFSQAIYPVTITQFQVKPSVFLSDYTEPSSERISATLVFNDLNEVSREVYLRLTIESSSIRLVTSANVVPNSFTLYVREPSQLRADDFIPYFSLQNLDCMGISKAELQRTGQLPEGWYTFSLEVLEFPTKKIISRKTSVRVRVELKEPPRPTFPQRGDLVKSNVPQFNFQFMHSDPEINASNTSYVLKLYEIDPSERQPQLAIVNRTARTFYESEPFRMLTYNYNLSHPILTPGMRYAYTITAHDDGGKPRFKNNGESEVFWFHFGYPTGGNIRLTYPPDGVFYSRFDVPTLYWDASDNIINSSQSVIYHCRVVVLNEGEDTIGVMDRGDNIFMEFSTPPKFDRRGAFMRTSTLAHLQRYAWQVWAESDGAEIARSEIRTFTGPPKIESFFMENHEVFLTKITNMYFNQFSGEGEFQIDASGRMQRVKFENLKIRNSDGIFVVDSGVILAPATEFDDIELSPSEEFRNNLTAIFSADSIRLCPQGLRLKGAVSWDFPLGVRNQNNPKLVSAQTWVVYTDYELLGQFFLPKEQRFELLEPAFFQMILNENSSFLVFRHTWTMNFSGHIEVNENLKAKESEIYRFPFYNLQQLFYNEITYFRPLEGIRLLSGADIFLEPKKIILDLSDAQSPGKFAMNNTWKGIYLEEFYLNFASNVDQSRQLKNFRQETLFYQQTESDSTIAYIIGNGLHCVISGDFNQDDPVHFYTFESELNNFNLEIRSGLFRSGDFRGRMYIPIISENEKFNWRLPLSDHGFSQGYLDESLNRLNFVFAPNDPESRLNVTVRRAVFKKLDHLSCDLEIAFPYINTTLTDLNDFRIFGNKEIGFGSSGGVLPLTHQRQTLYKDFDISLTSIGAGRICYEYSIGFRADIAMGEDISGGDGAPALNLYTFAPNRHLTEPCDKPEQDISTPEIFANRGEFEMSDEGVGECDGSSIAEEIEAQNAAIREQIAMMEAAMDALDEVEIDIQITYEEVGELITDSIKNHAEVELLPLPEVNQFTITREHVTNLLKIFKLFANEEQNRKIDATIKIIEDIENNELYQIYLDLKNGTFFKNIITAKAAELITYLTTPINAICDTAKNVVSRQILNMQNTVITKFDSLANIGFAPIEKFINEMSINDELKRMGTTFVQTSKNTLKNQISSAIRTSTDENITKQIHNFIDISIRNNIVGFIDSTIRQNVNHLISGQAKEISFSHITDEAMSALNRMGEDAKEFFSLETVRNMLVNTGNDILAKVNWQSIKNDIVSQLFDPRSGAITQAITGTATDLLGGFNSTLASNVVQNIDLLFNLKKRSKTDPIRIVFNTPVAEGEGYVKLDTADPVYGKVWKGSINAAVKKPTTFGVFATYIKGQTLGENSFKYWFLEFGADRLMLPLSPLPLYFTGGAGRVYQRMSRETPTSPYIPDRNVNFGAGVRATFVDQSKGGIFAMEVDLGLKLMNNGFELGMNGNVSVANRINSAESKVERSLITGTGSMLYSSVDKSFFANARVTANTTPLLCASGEFNAFITPDGWGVSVGTRENPMQANLLCRNFAKIGGWFDVNKTFLDLGLFQNIELNPKSPWIGPQACQVQAWAHFRYDFGLNTLVYWKPLRIRDAAVWLDVLVAVGANYRTPIRSGSLEFVNINFGGNLLYVSEPEAVLSGKLYGRLNVLGIRINVEMEATRNLASN